MTAADRARVKEALDARARARVELERRIAADYRGLCAGCGCEYDEKSAGCPQCSTRHLNRVSAARKASRAAWQKKRWHEDAGYRHRRLLNRQRSRAAAAERAALEQVAV